MHPTCFRLVEKQSGTVRLTHAQYRELVPLKSSNAPEVPQEGGGGVDGEVCLAPYPAIAEVTVQIQGTTFHGYA